jgi:hypothetical protein
LARGVAKAEAPEIEQLLGGYATGKSVMDTPIKSHVLPELKQNIADALHDEHFRDYLAPQTFQAIKELEAREGRPPTVMDIEGVRRLLGNVNPTNPKDLAAANIARDKINEYLAEIGEGDLIGGEKNVGQILTEIRGNYAAGKRASTIAQAEEKGRRQAGATGSGANLDNALRQAIKQVRNNSKLLRGFSKDEIAQMDRIIKGGRIGNAARLLSKFGPKHPVSGIIPAILTDIKGGLGAATGQLAVGALAQKVAEHTTGKRIRELQEMVRRRSPLGQQMQAAAPVEYLRTRGWPYRAGVADLISQLGGGNAAQ